jgi:hypothetical protein
MAKGGKGVAETANERQGWVNSGIRKKALRISTKMAVPTRRFGGINTALYPIFMVGLRRKRTFDVLKSAYITLLYLAVLHWNCGGLAPLSFFYPV